MSRSGQQPHSHATRQWYDILPANSQPPSSYAGTSVHAPLAQLDYTVQENVFYEANDQSSLWPYEIGLDPAYSIPGSSVGSIPLRDIEWQEIIDSGEGPSPSSDGKAKVSRRKEQNRAAQRAFRERKDRALIELQEAVKTSKERADELEAENNRLREELKESRVEIDTLRSVSVPSQQAVGSDDDGLDVSCKRVTNEHEDVVLVKIKIGEAETAER